KNPSEFRRSLIKIPKILIAEDDPQIRGLFSKILISRGYDTIEATDGEEVIKIYDELSVKPEIIVVDFSMPKMNGLEVTKELLKRDPTTNILMITGDPRVNQSAISNTGIRFKYKPVRMEEFLSEIRSIAQV
ncbi:MAG: response regulator, partial [Asgard group archaeon]|nr:response regulator [Asgard group archaeon]